MRVLNPITVLGSDGRPLAGALVHTRDRVSGEDARVYAAETGATPAANPATTDARGRALQWLDRGRYSSTCTADLMTPFVEPWDAVPADDDILIALALT